MNDLDFVLKIGTAAAAIIAAWLSMQSKTQAARTETAMLQMEKQINQNVDARFHEIEKRFDRYVPKTECDLLQRVASAEVDTLTEQVRSVDAQLRKVAHGIGKIQE